MTKYFQQVEDCVDAVIERVGNRIVLGIPLGLGKPNQWVNALYQRVKSNPELHLTVYTALSLETPQPRSSLEKRFLEPFYKRIFDGYVALEYLQDLRDGTLPKNIIVHEFFVKSGSFLRNSYVQQHYMSANYTHVPRDLMQRNVNVVAQLVTTPRDDKKGKSMVSLSCNPEITLEIEPWIAEKKRRGEPIVVVGQMHEQLPYMANDAAVSADMFDMLVDNREYDTRLFAPPDMPVSKTDYMIGLYASTLIKDGGTLQIGIGSLSDAIVYACKLRHEDNAVYIDILHGIQFEEKFASIAGKVGETGVFTEGLYGCSEMFVDGFWDLIKAGILKRQVVDHEGLQNLLNAKKITETPTPNALLAMRKAGLISSPLTQKDVSFLCEYGFFNADIEWAVDGLRRQNESTLLASLSLEQDNLQAIAERCLGSEMKKGVVMHGGFFLGPASFYQQLRNMTEAQRLRINMTGIRYINSLYGHQSLKIAQRQHARFFNTTFTVSLLGAATSDALDNGQVVSGVGGQYNFVEQGNELAGARSILLLRSTRTKNGKTRSNIVWSYGHVTIPRHLRDIYITEYGIADLRGKSDADVIKAMLNITDSRFQNELMRQAKAAGKLEKTYQIPEMYQRNFPDEYRDALKVFRAWGLLPRFPFGCEFTEQELLLGKALKWLKENSNNRLLMLRSLWQGWRVDPELFAESLKRMNLLSVGTLKERIDRALLLSALYNTQA